MEEEKKYGHRRMAEISFSPIKKIFGEYRFATKFE